MSDGWFRTDIGPHFLDCLNFSRRQISLVPDNIREWPWTIIGLAALVQSACALYLDERDTMGIATLSSQKNKDGESNQGQTIQALQHNSDKKVPKPFMAPPKDLLKRVQNGNDAIVLSHKGREDLKKLVEFRNEFTHFTPIGWSIQTAGLPRIAREAFSLVEVILEKPGLYRRISSEQREHAKELCVSAINQCDSLGIVK